MPANTRRAWGGPHTPEGILHALEQTDAGTGYMHESFNPDNPDEYTRPWLAWANSLFSVLICRHYHLGREERA